MAALTYAPGWVDRLTSRIEKLPGPAWFYYVGPWLILFAVETSIKWSDGTYPVGTFFPFHFHFAGGFFYSIAFVHYLDSLADRSLQTFKPAFKGQPADFELVRYELTHMPSRTTALVSVLGIILAVVIGLLTPSNRQILGILTSPVASVFDTFLFCIDWIGYSVLFYHTVHQWRVVRKIGAVHSHVNLFNLGPLYSLSNLTAQTAIGWLLITYTWNGSMPQFLTDAVSLGVTAALTVLAVITFIGPLAGIHNLLEDEKERLQSESSSRMEAAVRDLHRRLDTSDLQDMQSLHNALLSLELEQRALDKLRTWPWRTQTFGTFATAVLLPIVLWFVERLLENLF